MKEGDKVAGDCEANSLGSSSTCSKKTSELDSSIIVAATTRTMKASVSSPQSPSPPSLRSSSLTTEAVVVLPHNNTSTSKSRDGKPIVQGYYQISVVGEVEQFQVFSKEEEISSTQDWGSK
jgi:hypothetical protein